MHDQLPISKLPFAEHPDGDDVSCQIFTEKGESIGLSLGSDVVSTLEFVGK